MPPENSNEQRSTVARFPTEDTVSLEKLQMLSRSIFCKLFAAIAQVNFREQRGIEGYSKESPPEGVVGQNRQV